MIARTITRGRRIITCIIPFTASRDPPRYTKIMLIGNNAKGSKCIGL